MGHFGDDPIGFEPSLFFWLIGLLERILIDREKESFTGKTLQEEHVK